MCRNHFVYSSWESLCFGEECSPNISFLSPSITIGLLSKTIWEGDVVVDEDAEDVIGELNWEMTHKDMNIITSCSKFFRTKTHTDDTSPWCDKEGKHVAPPLIIAALWLWKDSLGEVKENRRLFATGDETSSSSSRNVFFRFGISLFTCFSWIANRSSPGISFTLLWRSDQSMLSKIKENETLNIVLLINPVPTQTPHVDQVLLHQWSHDNEGEAHNNSILDNRELSQRVAPVSSLEVSSSLHCVW